RRAPVGRADQRRPAVGQRPARPELPPGRVHRPRERGALGRAVATAGLPRLARPGAEGRLDRDPPLPRAHPAREAALPLEAGQLDRLSLTPGSGRAPPRSPPTRDPARSPPSAPAAGRRARRLPRSLRWSR